MIDYSRLRELKQVCIADAARQLNSMLGGLRQNVIEGGLESY